MLPSSAKQFKHKFSPKTMSIFYEARNHLWQVEKRVFMSGKCFGEKMALFRGENCDFPLKIVIFRKKL